MVAYYNHNSGLSTSRSQHLLGIVTLFALTLLVGCPVAGQANDEHQNDITVSLSAFCGVFDLSLTDVTSPDGSSGEAIGFNDVYGSKSGFTYGVEMGVGLTSVRTFGVIRYRRWHKSGQPVLPPGRTFEGDMDWTQSFVSFGLRHYPMKWQMAVKAILPYVGGGIVYSQATESADGAVFHESSLLELRGEVDLHGTGYYLECGCDVCAASDLSLRVMLEYSGLNLSPDDQDLERKSDGGGGLFLGIGANAFF